MYRVAELKDIVRLKPKRFAANRVDALTLEINKKYANKVIYKVGLVVCLFDIQEIQESHIFPGDGSAHVYVKFRLIVFRPFVGELLQGTIDGSTAEHIKVSINFFRDIYIPATGMRADMAFDVQRQVWVWDYVDDDGTAHKLDLAKGGVRGRRCETGVKCYFHIYNNIKIIQRCRFKNLSRVWRQSVNLVD
eukprot:m.127474 g.127474  ORF g.127474 m.127474 type:complete len:191 (-) comp15801_c0_seq5:626-1198(-)